MRKPRIKIERTGLQTRPWIFLVRWPGRAFRNSTHWTFIDALHAAGLKGLIK